MSGVYNNNVGNEVRKITRQSEKYVSPSGQAVEVLWIEEIRFANGQIEKLRYFENQPPLADGRVAKSADDIRECCVCFKQLHRDSVNPCSNCGKSVCKNNKCRTVEASEESEATICLGCYEELNMNCIKRALKGIWSLE